uniref:Uncharacterized protein n=1 Tax=Ditylenchus dipsaci TaxID=166011 RepID=A0A915DI46_9BILA
MLEGHVFEIKQDEIFGDVQLLQQLNSQRKSHGNDANLALPKENLQWIGDFCSSSYYRSRAEKSLQLPEESQYHFGKKQKIEQLRADAVKTIGVTLGKYGPIVHGAPAKIANWSSTYDKPLKDVKFLPCFQQAIQGDRFLLYDSRDAEPGQSVMFIFLFKMFIRLLRDNPN